MERHTTAEVNQTLEMSLPLCDMSRFPPQEKIKTLSHHLHAAVFLKCGGEVGHHLLGQDLHRLVLQVVFPDKVLAG